MDKSIKQDGDGLLSGAEPWSFIGGRVGVVCLHNFTAHPGIMRSLGERLVENGYSVEVPLLRGHGKSVHDIVPYRWRHFLEDARSALERIQTHSDTVVLVGGGCGGICALNLASSDFKIDGVAVINAPTGPMDAGRVARVEKVVAGGQEIVTDGPGSSDINRTDGHNIPSEGTPARTFLSLHAASSALDVSRISCPVIGFYSASDRTLLDIWSHAERLRDQASGSVELVKLLKSGHIAMVDYDSQLIEDRILEFVGDVARESSVPS